jgi:hypothetical protein
MTKKTRTSLKAFAVRLLIYCGTVGFVSLAYWWMDSLFDPICRYPLWVGVPSLLALYFVAIEVRSLIEWRRQRARD